LESKENDVFQAISFGYYIYGDNAPESVIEAYAFYTECKSEMQTLENMHKNNFQKIQRIRFGKRERIQKGKEPEILNFFTVG